MKIKVTLKDLVNGQVAMGTLISRPMVGKVSYRVAKAIKKARAEIETYNESVAAIIKRHDCIPTPQGGVKLNPKAKDYDKTLAELEKHYEAVLKEEVELDGVMTVKLDELLGAIPAISETRDEIGKIITPTVPQGSIEPFILSALDWLIVE